MINFIKLHCCGNDFIFFFKIINKYLFFKIYNNKSGLISDQLFFIKNINFINKKIIIKIFNNDFSKAFNCGNGIRSLSWYLLKKKKYILKIFIKKNCTYSWNIKKNNFNLFKINKNLKFIFFKIKNIFLKIFFVEIGNFHIVLLINNINSFYIIKIEKFLRKYFNNKINIEFLQLINKNEFFIRIFEKGVNETLSCGSGIISSCYFLNYYFLFNNLKVNSLGGECFINIHKKNVFIKGLTNFCFNFNI